MQDWIMMIMERFGYIGVFLLILLENVFPPIPSEVILTFGGFMVTRSAHLSFFGMLTASTLGALAGALLLYFLGHKLGLTRLTRIVTKYGKFLRIDEDDLIKANHWFTRYGGFAVFICRFVPLIRSLISIPAGINQMKLIPFILYTTIGTLIWNGVLIYLGQKLGENWEQVVQAFNQYSHFFYIVLGLLLILGFVYLRRRKK